MTTTAHSIYNYTCILYMHGSASKTMIYKYALGYISIDMKLPMYMYIHVPSSLCTRSLSVCAVLDAMMVPSSGT